MSWLHFKVGLESWPCYQEFYCTFGKSWCFKLLKLVNNRNLSFERFKLRKLELHIYNNNFIIFYFAEATFRQYFLILTGKHYHLIILILS